MRKRVGFIGLGNIGKPMAKSLVRAGFAVTVCDVSPEPVAELKEMGAAAVAQPRQVAEASDVIITMVRDDAETDEVVRGKGGVLEGAGSGSTILLMSTLSPGLCQHIAREAGKKGIRVLDAPVSGGRWGAEAGSLTIMVGGEKSVLDECRPILEAMGKNVFHLGDVGMGEVGKLVNNLVFYLNLVGLTEGLTLGARAGINLDVLRELIGVSSGRSCALGHWDDYAEMKRQRDPVHFAIIYKDIRLAVELGQKLGVVLPLIELTSRLDVGKLPEA